MKQLELFPENTPQRPSDQPNVRCGGSQNPIVFHDYESNVAKFRDLPKTTDDTYTPPDELLSVSDLQKICNGGIDFAVRRSECVRVRSLDLHPKRGGLFGDHFLIAKAKAKAKAQAKRTIHIPLSEREQRIVERLGADTAPPAEQ